MVRSCAKGEKMKHPMKASLKIALPQDLRDALQAYADKRGVSLGAEIRARLAASIRHEFTTTIILTGDNK